MGHNSSTISCPNYTAIITTKDKRKFLISYHALVEHILLLRKVIDHPEMTKQGSILDYYINNYCKRMAQDRLRTRQQQSKLPWPLEWIWHVHRLHPIEYLNDCQKQLSNGLVDKQTDQLLLMNYKKKTKRKSSSKNSRSSFVPSIDLSNAIIRQNDFLEKFQQHFFYSYNLNEFNPVEFRKLVANYIEFIKLGNDALKNLTFDIDLIWHTHLRYPSMYQELSKAACGFILNHDDSLEQSITLTTEQKTCDQWKEVQKPKINTVNMKETDFGTSDYESSSGRDFTYTSTVVQSKSSDSNLDHDHDSSPVRTHRSYDYGSHADHCYSGGGGYSSGDYGGGDSGGGGDCGGGGDSGGGGGGDD